MCISRIIFEQETGWKLQIFNAQPAVNATAEGDPVANYVFDVRKLE